ncbi:MAG: hypothetical protein QNJ72_33850 [Pleurocapsa sp. MO_226.B13]|nr:hypothetical protein [Pleurocapsa sp. MO_226.B13]
MPSFAGQSIWLSLASQVSLANFIMPQEKPKKAVVATVAYAGFEFPGLQLPDGNYAIAVPQVGEIFQFVHSNEQRAIKRLLGKDFQFVQAASELNPKKVNIIPLDDFGRLVNAIARSTDKAYEKSRELAFAIQDASVTTTIEQAFDIAFDNKQALEEYQEKQKARVQGKVARRNMTNVVRDYVKAHGEELSDNYKKFIYNNCTDRTYRLVFGRGAKKLREDWDCTDVRAAMTVEELFIVRGVEDLAMKLIEEGTEPQKAIDEVGERLMIKKIERK